MGKISQSIKDRLRNISKGKDVNFNSVMRSYVYDRFVERLSRSEYRENLVIKGGFCIATLFGIENRSTMDIDTALRYEILTDEIVRKIMNEIANIEIDDGVKFKVVSTSPIRDNDEYGGIRVTFQFKLDNITDSFHVDVATGGPMFPRPKLFNYDALISDETFRIRIYPIETILAEKLETIIRLGELSTRMKDYYDVYLICQLKLDELKVENLKIAARRTFKKRSFNGDIYAIIKNLSKSEVLKERWESYAKKNSFATNVSFEDTIRQIRRLARRLS